MADGLAAFPLHPDIHSQQARFLWSRRLAAGGDNRDRTDDPLLAKQVLSQLSYTPIFPECSFEPQKLNNEIKVLII